MKKFLLLMVTLLLAAGTARADKKPPPPEGTTDAELKALKLPLPANTKVAILPFGDFGGDDTRKKSATATAFLFFEHEGFVMVPILDSYKAVADDKEIEPSEDLRRTDAARVGKSLGAAWAVYGAVKGVNVASKTSFWTGATKKTSQLSLRLSVVDCESGQLVFWRTLTAKKSAKAIVGGIRPEKRTRIAILVAIRDLLKPFFAVLPPHETVANIPNENAKHVPDDVDVLTFINKTWPPAKK